MGAGTARAGRLVVAVLAGTLAAACATPTPQPLLDARKELEAARADGVVQQYGSVQLYEAEQALERAEKEWTQDEDVAETSHLAYLARRQVDLAHASAEAGQAAEQAEALARQRDSVRLAARTSEAERARSAAEVRAQEAQQARLQAEERAREAALAREEAEAARQEALRAAEREKALREQLAELEARQTDRGLVLTLGDVLFDVDQASLKPGALQSLYRLVTFLKENPDRQVLVEGHTDSTGSDAYNLDLSRRRAEAVTAFLTENGIDPSRSVARGYGKAYPVAGNETAAGRQRNRRVEIVILDAGEKAVDEVRPTAPPAS
jgi:outer membrane protein OmpA-like peptidoglycan-associated protein